MKLKKHDLSRERRIFVAAYNIPAMARAIFTIPLEYR